MACKQLANWLGLESLTATLPHSRRLIGQVRTRGYSHGVVELVLGWVGRHGC
jgi:hypothetical protein